MRIYAGISWTLGSDGKAFFNKVSNAADTVIDGINDAADTVADTFGGWADTVGGWFGHRRMLLQLPAPASGGGGNRSNILLAEQLLQGGGSPPSPYHRQRPESRKRLWEYTKNFPFFSPMLLWGRCFMLIPSLRRCAGVLHPRCSWMCCALVAVSNRPTRPIPTCTARLHCSWLIACRGYVRLPPSSAIEVAVGCLDFCFFPPLPEHG